ncbi:uncharacterized protein LOC101847277 [Aplysia californica]|uniref:Uncharacterized protein LOC101847277 n=1 Tax=Aplysia californica TaxID=6500 RepID=A0ABM0JWX7_APLCA|nr:uncharacterized protein LOC101847277 [Aplysia californica]
MYYDESSGLTPKERREMYDLQMEEEDYVRMKEKEKEEELREIRAQEEREKEAIVELEKKLDELEKMKNEVDTREGGKRINPGCVTSCDELTAGKYPSCKGCDHFALCTKHGYFRERKCKNNREFDVDVNKCVQASSTCFYEGQ